MAFNKKRRCYGIVKKHFVVSSITYLVFALLSYGYMMVKDVHNYDTLVSTPVGEGAGLNLGRWLAYLLYWGKRKLLGGPWYNSSFINICVSLFFIYLATLVIILVLEVDDLPVIIAVTAISVANPCVAVTLIFHFSAISYSVAILLTAVGVWCVKQKKVYLFLLGTVLIGTGIAGYQAYITLAAALFAYLVIRMIIKQEEVKEILLQALSYFCALVISYVYYRMMLILFLRATNTELAAYQGVDSMGKIELSTLVDSIQKTYRNMFWLTRGDYLSLSQVPLLHLCFIAIYIISLISVIRVICLNRKKNVKYSILLIIVFTILPIILDSIEVIAPKAHVYSLMGIAVITVCYLPFVLHNCEFPTSGIWRNVSVGVLLIMSFTYIYITNVNATALYYNLEVSKNWNESLYNRIISTKDYTNETRIVVVGDQFSNAPENPYDIDSLLYQGATLSPNVYSKESFMRLYVGHRYQECNGDLGEKYKGTIEQMGVFPDYDSVIVRDGVVLVKISE